MTDQAAFQPDFPDPGSAPAPLTWRMGMWLLIATVLAGGLRLYHLGDWSFWEDELYSLREAVDQRPAQYCKRMGHLPVKVGLWASGATLEGVSPEQPSTWRAHKLTEFRARIGPCLIGILSIPLLALASRRVFGDRAAILLALLLALSPWHLYWSQAARFYSQQFLFYNLALLWYFEATWRKSFGGLLSAMACVVLAFLSQPPAIFIACVFAADWLFPLIRRRPVKLGIGGYVAIIVTFAFCLGLYQLDKRLFAGNFQHWGALKGQSAKVIVMGTVFKHHPVLLAAAGLSALALWRWRPRLAAYLAAGVLMPTAALVALNLLKGESFYVHVRYAFITHFAVLALAAAGLDLIYQAVRDRGGLMAGHVATATLFIALLFADFKHLTHGYGYHERWKDAFAFVHEQTGDSAAAIACDRRLISHYYLQSEDVTDLMQNRKNRMMDTVRGLQEPTWLVVRGQTPTGGLSYPKLPQIAQFKAAFQPRDIYPVSSIHVYYFDPDQPPLGSRPKTHTPSREGQP